MANPNVLFKRGLQQNLPSTAIDGVFYLTTDTHRLYVGQDTTPVLLNQTVQFVSSIAELTAKSATWTEAQKQAHLHDLYYVLPGAGDASNTSRGNILAVWCHDSARNEYAWVQINPDHNTYVTKLALETLAGSSNDANVNITMDRNDGESQKITFKVKGQDKTIQVTADANKAGFILRGDTYTLSKPATGEIKLTSTLGQAASSVKLVGGDNVTIEDVAGAGNENKIQIKSHNTKNDSASLTLNKDTGAITVTIRDTDGDEESASTGAIAMKYGASGDLSAPLGGTLNVYSKTEVDNKLKDLNGLTFIGSVGENGTYTMGADYKVYQGSTALTLHSGDMFLVAGDITYATDAHAKTGDLLIATGTETNGTLSTVTWTYVPSGDDAQLDTSYHFDGTTSDNTMTIRSKTTLGDEGIAGKMTFEAGTATTITSKVDGNTAEKNEFLTVTIGHANVSCDNVTNSTAIDLSEQDFVNAVTGVTVNAQGHVTNVTTTKVIPPRYTLNATPKLTADTSGVLSTVQIQHGLVLGGNNPVYETTGYKIQSNSLNVTAVSGNVQIDCVWGDF